MQDVRSPSTDPITKGSETGTGARRWWTDVMFRGGTLCVDSDDDERGRRGLVAIRKPPGANPIEAVECANKALASASAEDDSPRSTTSADVGGERCGDDSRDDGSASPLLIPVEPFLRRCSSRPIQGWSVAAWSQEAADELVRRIDEVSGTFMAVVDDFPRGTVNGEDGEENEKEDRADGAPRIRVISSHRTRNTSSGFLHLIEIECPRLARDGVGMKSLLQKRHGCSVVGGRAHNVAPLKGLGGRGARTFLALVRLSLPGVLGSDAVTVEQEVPARYFKTLEKQEGAYDEWHGRLNGEPDGDPSDAGLVSFCGRDFSVPPGVFSPRFGSEALVSAALDSLPPRDDDRGGAPPRVLDLGTGTGCLLLSLLLGDPGGASFGVGVDLSPDAIDAARANAARTGIDRDGRVAFVVGDFLSPDLPSVVNEALSALSGVGVTETDAFDVVVCNPPYLDPEHLPPSFVDNEEKLQSPSTALFAGEYGLDVYRAFSGQDGLASRWKEAGLVKSGTVLVLEVPSGGARITDRVERMFVAADESDGSSEGGNTSPLMKSLGVRRDGRNARRCIVLQWL